MPRLHPENTPRAIQRAHHEPQPALLPDLPSVHLLSTRVRLLLVHKYLNIRPGAWPFRIQNNTLRAVDQETMPPHRQADTRITPLDRYAASLTW